MISMAFNPDPTARDLTRASAPKALSNEEILVHTVKLAGQSIMTFWQQLQANENSIQTSLKPDDTPVSIADLSSERIICHQLRKYFPSMDVVSEEQGYRTFNNIQNFWLVDPLDGTRGFLDGSTDFAILIARIENGKAAEGIVYYPALDEYLFTNSVGKSICEDKGKRSEITCSNSSLSNESTIDLIHFETTLDHRVNVDRWESTRAIIEVAKGNVDATIVKLCGHKPWDIAAPAAILTHACGVLINEKGEQLDYRENDLQSDFLIASSPQKASRLKDFLKSVN
jgi:3'(2'), 5'-bisphosphate nucleotidase